MHMNVLFQNFFMNLYMLEQCIADMLHITCAHITELITYWLSCCFITISCANAINMVLLWTFGFLLRMTEECFCNCHNIMAIAASIILIPLLVLLLTPQWQQHCSMIIITLMLISCQCHNTDAIAGDIMPTWLLALLLVL